MREILTINPYQEKADNAQDTKQPITIENRECARY